MIFIPYPENLSVLFQAELRKKGNKENDKNVLTSLWKNGGKLGKSRLKYVSKYANLCPMGIPITIQQKSERASDSLTAISCLTKEKKMASAVATVSTQCSERKYSSSRDRKISITLLIYVRWEYLSQFSRRVNELATLSWLFHAWLRRRRWHRQSAL